MLWWKWLSGLLKRFTNLADFIITATVVIREDFKCDPILLLLAADAIVQFGVVNGQSAVISEDFERLFIFVGERAVSLVHHLDHSDDVTADEDRHAQYRLGPIARLLIYRSIKTRVRVCVCDIQHLISTHRWLSITQIPITDNLITQSSSKHWATKL